MNECGGVLEVLAEWKRQNADGGARDGAENEEKGDRDNWNTCLEPRPLVSRSSTAGSSSISLHNVTRIMIVKRFGLRSYRNDNQIQSSLCFCCS